MAYFAEWTGVTESTGSPGALLSLCVPTFNRAPNLRNLLEKLLLVKHCFDTELEICVSDNASSDETRLVIEAYSESLSLKVVRQDRNVGGTLNIIEVVQIATARWVMLLGDDDEIIPEGLDRLMQALRSDGKEDWVLVESMDVTNQPLHLLKFEDGIFTRAKFRAAVLKNGMNCFGFMGVHVFPRAAIPTFRALAPEDVRPWPHMACMLRHTAQPGCRVRVLRQPVVLQAADAKLFWMGGDLALIRLDMIRVLSRSYRSHGSFFFYHVLMLRQLFSRLSLRSLISWKLYEPDDFAKRGVRSYVRTYAFLGIFAPLTLPHLLLTCAVRLIPASLYSALFRLIGLGHFLTRYQTEKRVLGAFDGIKRGI